MAEQEERIQKYARTERFRVIDTIGVPHPYCISPKHLEYANMYLDREAIRRGEEHGAKCDICRKRVRKKLQERILSYDEHEQALLVEVEAEELKEVESELREYLLSIKEQAEKDGYAGFAFKKKEAAK